MQTKIIRPAPCPPPVTFPCLRAGGSSGSIYLFHSREAFGLMIAQNIGMGSVGISKLSYGDSQPFHGEVVLSNDE